STRRHRPTREWVWPQDAAARLAAATVPPAMPLAEALVRLDDAGTGVLLVADDAQRLLAILTDGDFRRHVLAGGSLDQASVTIASADPITAPPGLSPAEALQLMDTARDF